MKREDKLIVLKNRLNHIVSRGKSIEFPGVRIKLERQIRKMEADN